MKSSNIAIQLTVVIEIKKNRKQYCKWYGDEDIDNADIPEVNKPSAILCRKKSLAGWESRKLDIAHMPYMDETSKDNQRQRSPIIVKEFSDVVLE